MIKQLQLESVKDLDAGKITTAFNHELDYAARDCLDRPGDTRPRTITLQVDLKPIIDDDGLCESINIKFQTRCKIPTRRSKAYNLSLRKNGAIAFSDTSADGKPTMFHDLPQQ